MSMHDITPGSPEDQGSLEQLFRDVFILADEVVAQITEEEVTGRLTRLLRDAGRGDDTITDVAAGSVVEDLCRVATGQEARARAADAALREARQTAEQLVTAAQREARAKAREAEEVLRAAIAARLEAERMRAEASSYNDAALRQAAAIVANAQEEAQRLRTSAESYNDMAKQRATEILVDARFQAERLIADAREASASATAMAPVLPARWPDNRTATDAIHACLGESCVEARVWLPAEMHHVPAMARASRRFWMLLELVRCGISPRRIVTCLRGTSVRYAVATTRLTPVPSTRQCLQGIPTRARVLVGVPIEAQSGQESGRMIAVRLAGRATYTVPATPSRVSEQAQPLELPPAFMAAAPGGPGDERCWHSTEVQEAFAWT